MAEDPKPDAAPKRLRPTVIEPPAGRVKRRKDVAPPPATVLAPTAIPGVERRRIEVGPADIARLFPGASPKAAARAARLIDGFVVEGAREQHVAQWGEAAQQRYAALVSATPEPSQVDALERARGYVGRISALLGAIDLAAIGDVGRSARDELRQLVLRSQTALDPLRALAAARRDHCRHVGEAGFEIEAAALGATFLADHLATPRPDLSRRFLQREMSLTKTALEIRSGQFERDGQREDASALVAVIQDVVLSPLPDWLDGVAVLAKARRRPNPTEAGDLQHRLRALLRNLEP